MEMRDGENGDFPQRWRKRPVVIDAYRFTEDNAPAVIEWVRGGGGQVMGWSQGPDGKAWDLSIRTLEGDMRADPGDWIICGVQGEFYPCKPDIFEATYEPAETGGRQR